MKIKKVTCVEMESSALYAFAKAKNKDVICFERCKLIFSLFSLCNEAMYSQSASFSKYILPHFTVNLIEMRSGGKIFRINYGNLRSRKCNSIFGLNIIQIQFMIQNVSSHFKYKTPLNIELQCI